MIIQLEVQSDTATILATQAQQHGLSVDAYLRRLVHEHNSVLFMEAQMSPQEKAALWLQGAASYNLDTPLLSDEAISRASIYGEIC